jgi:hypothetical protein
MFQYPLIGSWGWKDDLNPTVLAFEFPGLDMSPWLFEYLQEFTRKPLFKSGDVFRFDGKFRNYLFDGTFICIAHYGGA